MKIMTKIMVLILALLMLCTAMISCNDEEVPSAETKAEGSENETGTDEPNGFTTIPEIEKKNYGADFVLSIMEDCNKFEWYWVEKSQGDAMSESLYARQEAVYNHIGVSVYGKKHTGNFKTYTEEYKTAVKNKDDSLQMMVTHVNLGINGLISGNYLQDLQTVEGLLLDADYWNGDVMETLSIEGRMYLGKNQFNILYTNAITFNKSMMAQYEDVLGSTVYEMVDDYKWTLDQMIDLAKQVSIDTKSDGKSVDDTFGITGRQWEPFCGFAQASNIPLVDMNERGEYVVSFYNEMNKDKSVSLVEKLKNLTNSANAWFWPIDNSVPSLELPSGRVLMQLTSTNNLPNLCNYKDLSFGVLPYPMYDEAQADVGYRHLQWGGYTVLPSYVASPQMVAETMELLAYYSYDVNNTFYEKLIGKQAADAPDDRRMLELVWETICTDFGQTYSETDSVLYFVPELTSSSATVSIASYVATKERATNTAIKKFMKTIK